jgi:folate-binding protein YgfZ
MNSEWLTFLQSQGALTDADGGVHFPPAAGHPGCLLFDLSHLGLLALRGEEADSFLQGQLTNDVRELTEEHCQLSSHCSAKGRMLANFRLLRRDGVIYLQMPRENVAPLLKRFSMFKLRAKVEISDADAELVCIGIAGDNASALLKTAALAVPEGENSVTRNADVSIARLPGTLPRFELFGPAAALISLWSQWVGQATVQTADDWALLEIRAGMPTVYGATAEAFVPQMTNMQLIDGVSFTKGCYTGQEVVARMQYLGKLKRRMYLAEVRSPTPPRPGDELVADASASGQGAGRVVDARASADDCYELLAVVEIAAVEHSTVRLGENGPTLRFLDLPYAFADNAAPQR